MCSNREPTLPLAMHPRAWFCDIQSMGPHTAPTLARSREHPRMGELVKAKGSPAVVQLTASMCLAIQSWLQLPASLTTSCSLDSLAQNTSQDKHKLFPTSPWLSANPACSNSQKRCNFGV